jgi:predicted NBD/HSP70 family sugar kinase
MIKRGNIQSELNQHQIIKLLRQKGPITRPELLRTTGLSRPTVDKIIEGLKEAGIATEVGTQHVGSRSGRRPTLISLDGSSKFIIGIDLEFPPVRAVIADLNSIIIIRKQLTLGLTDAREDILNRLQKMIHAMIKESGVPRGSLLGIGVGIPGVIDYANGISQNIERLNDWSEVPIKEILEKEFRMPAFVDNDVNLMALSEANVNEKALDKNLLFVALRQGIGAGVIIGGQLYHGSLGNSGFIGHTTIDYRGPRCRCGKRGCVELYADEPAIELAAADRIGKGEISMLSTDKGARISAQMVYDAARRDDRLAKSILHDAGWHLGIGITNLVYSFDINHVLLGGNAHRAGADYLTGVREAFDTHLRYAFQRGMVLDLARTDDYAAAIGATLTVLDYVFKAPELPRIAATR